MAAILVLSKLDPRQGGLVGKSGLHAAQALIELAKLSVCLMTGGSSWVRVFGSPMPHAVDWLTCCLVPQQQHVAKLTQDGMRVRRHS